MHSLFELFCYKDIRLIAEAIRQRTVCYIHFKKTKKGEFRFADIYDTFPQAQSDDIVVCYDQYGENNFLDVEHTWTLWIDAYLRVVHKTASVNTKEKKPVLLNEEHLLKLLELPSALQKIISDFRPREGQQYMMRQVIKTFNTGNMLVVEAGTGIGKTFAYLIPALALVHLNKGQRVVISTATIPLQQQIYHKDIAIIAQLFSTSIKVALAKGKTHYLCHGRLRDYMEIPKLWPSSVDIEQIYEWAQNSQTGDRSELPFSVSDAQWKLFAADNELCSVAKCRHKDHCFLMRARKEIKEADIIITNHAYLFLDLSVKKEDNDTHGYSILPSFKYLIIDEAHTIHDIICAVFSTRFSSQGLLLYLDKITTTLLILKKNNALSQKELESIEHTIHDLESYAKRLNVLMHETFAEEKERSFHLHALDDNARENLSSLCVYISDALYMLQIKLREVSDILKSAEDVLIVEQYMNLLQKWRIFLENFDTSYFKNNDSDNEKDYIGYIEQKERSYPLVITPISIAQLLRECIQDQLYSTVLTSASLTVNGDFRYWIQQTGLDEAHYERIASPFSYDYQQIQLYVPQNLGLPNESHYVGQLAELITGALQASQGGALVLFTAYGLMQQCRHLLENKKLPYTLLSQGDKERSILLKEFAQDVHSVLLGVNSFWAGVDIPGQSLRLLIVTKLPFGNLDDIILKARCDIFEQKYGMQTSFMGVRVPDAVLRFRQGFGRLIRKEQDRGIVLICDKRICTKNYGRMFLASLPRIQQILPVLEEGFHMDAFYQDQQKIISHIQQFFYVPNE